MTDVDKIMLGGIVGVLIYVIGQLLSRFFIEPLYELKSEVGQVRYNLAFYSSIIHTPIGRKPDVSEAARLALLGNSSNLIAKLHATPCYSIIRHMGALPNRKDVEEAAKLLRGLSTYMHEQGNKAGNNICKINRIVSKIEKLLDLKLLK